MSHINTSILLQKWETLLPEVIFPIYASIFIFFFLLLGRSATLESVHCSRGGSYLRSSVDGKQVHTDNQGMRRGKNDCVVVFFFPPRSPMWSPRSRSSSFSRRICHVPPFNIEQISHFAARKTLDDASLSSGDKLIGKRQKCFQFSGYRNRSIYAKSEKKTWLKMRMKSRDFHDKISRWFSEGWKIERGYKYETRGPLLVPIWM